MKSYYCEAVEKISFISHKMDLPIWNTLFDFSTFFNSIQEGTSFSVTQIFMNAFYKVIHSKRIDSQSDIYWPILYIQWPGCKQRIEKGIIQLNQIMEDHFKEINPEGCLDGLLVDLRVALFASKTEFQEKTNSSTYSPLSVMWNPDKIRKILTLVDEESMNFWKVRKEEEEEEEEEEIISGEDKDGIISGEDKDGIISGEEKDGIISEEEKDGIISEEEEEIFTEEKQQEQPAEDSFISDNSSINEQQQQQEEDSSISDNSSINEQQQQEDSSISDNSSITEQLDNNNDDDNFELLTPNLTSDKVDEFSCYGTHVWRDVFGKLYIYIYFF